MFCVLLVPPCTCRRMWRRTKKAQRTSPWPRGGLDSGARGLSQGEEKARSKAQCPVLSKTKTKRRGHRLTWRLYRCLCSNGATKQFVLRTDGWVNVPNFSQSHGARTTFMIFTFWKIGKHWKPKNGKHPKNSKNIKKIRSQNHARNDRGEILSIFHTGRHGIRQISENPVLGSISCQNLILID